MTRASTTARALGTALAMTLSASAGCSNGPAPASTQAAAAVTGTLLLDATPRARVFVDDISRGLTPVRVDVAAGLHRVRFEGDGTAKSLDVEVTAGQELSRSVDLSGSGPGLALVTARVPAPRPASLPARSAAEPTRPAPAPVAAASGTVNVNALPWAEVWLDGRHIGETPLANVKTSVGTHEILLRHPELGDVRQTVSVRSGQPTRVTVSMKK